MQTPGTHIPSGAAALDSSMLLPPVSALLLPPISPLVPPDANLIKGGIAASSGTMMGGSTRADETLEQFGQHLNKNFKELSGRTSDFVATQAPRIQAARRNATAYINKAASKAAHELGNAENRRSFVQNYRKWLLAGCGGFAGLLLVGWGMAHHFASVKARTAVHDALQSANLLGMVQYDDVSASPLGSVSIYGVKWHVAPDIDVQIASVNLSNIDRAHTIPHHIDVQAKGMEIPVSKMVTHRVAMGPSEDMIRSLARLGYNTVTGTMDVGYSLQESQSDMTIHTSGSLDGLGNWNMKADLGQVSARLLDLSLLSQLAQGSQYANRLLLLSALQDLYRITLQNTELTVDATDGVKRAKELPDTPLPPEETTEEATAREQARLEEDARRKGLSADQAHIIALLQNNQLTHFTLKTDNENPIRVAELANVSPTNFILRTNATLSK